MISSLISFRGSVPVTAGGFDVSTTKTWLPAAWNKVVMTVFPCWVAASTEETDPLSRSHSVTSPLAENLMTALYF